MASVVKHYYEDSWVDITDYIDGISEVPTILRNRDYTLKSERLRLSIAATIRDVRGVNYEFEEGGKFAIYIDDDLKFQGIIESSEYIYRDMVFDIELRHCITDLEKVMIEHDTLHDSLAEGTEYWEYKEWDFTITIYDIYTFTAVGVTWAMKCIFDLAGLTLDTSEVDDIEIFTNKGWAPRPPIILDPVTIKYKDLFFTENSLYCIGQSSAVKYTTIDANGYYDTEDPPVWHKHELSQNKINGFELVSNLLSALGLVLEQTDLDTYKLIQETENFSITDDAKFEYAKRKLQKENENAGITTYLGRSSDNVYPDVTQFDSIVPIDFESYKLPGADIDLLPYLFIFYGNMKNMEIPFSYDDLLLQYLRQIRSMDLIYTLPDSGTILNIAAKKVQEKTKSLIEEEIDTNYQSTFKSVEQHDIDLEWSNSKIKQVTYNE